MDKNLIEIDMLNYIFVKVSEEINQSMMDDFILTALKNQNIKLIKNHYCFYTYLKHSNEYQISYYNSDDKKHHLSIEYMHNNNIGITLFIAKNYFLVFIENSLYYYQKIDLNIDIQDISIYVEQRLNVNIDNVLSIDAVDFIYEKKNKRKLNYIHQNNSFHLKIFSTYVICIILFFTLFVFYEQEYISNMHENKRTNIEKKYQNLLLKNRPTVLVSAGLSKLFENLNRLNIQISSLQLKKNRYHLKLFAKNKEDLYTFLNYYKTYTSNKNIEYLQSREIYVLYTELTLNK